MKEYRIPRTCRRNVESSSVSACCTGASAALKSDVQFHGSLSTYVKKYSARLNSNIPSDGKARPFQCSTLIRNANLGGNIKYFYLHPTQASNAHRIARLSFLNHTTHVVFVACLRTCQHAQCVLK